jgi:hypothetical protein
MEKTKAKERALWSEIRKWLERLQLSKWAVGWYDASDDENAENPDAAATLTPDIKYLVASLRMQQMIHLLLTEYRELVQELAMQLHPDVGNMAMDRMHTIDEHVVTQLCRAFEGIEPLVEDQDVMVG